MPAGCSVLRPLFGPLFRPIGSYGISIPTQGGGVDAAFFARPFAARSIWNIGQPAGTTYAGVHNGAYNAATAYTVGDTVTRHPDDGGEAYCYVKLTNGTGHALPAGTASNANWGYVAIGFTPALTDGGLPRYSAVASDPQWLVRFNVNAYAGLTGGWGSLTDDQIWATGVDIYPTAYNPYSTSTADASGGSPTPPVAGSYIAKNKAIGIFAPSGIAPAGVNLDWTMIVRQPNGMVFEGLYCKVLSGNRLIVGGYGMTDPSKYGDGVQNGFRASMIPGYAGCITASEWATALASADGSAAEVLPHKLALLVPRQLLTMTGGPAVYPAKTADSQFDTVNAYNGKKIITGQPLQVDPTLLTDGWFNGYYNLPANGGKAVKIIARTAVEQGLIALDRGGSGVGILAEKGMFTAYDYFMDATLRLALNYLRRSTISASQYDTTPVA